MSDSKFIPGLFFKDKHQNAPDFVMCKGSIKVRDMIDWLQQQEGEWVNFDLKRSRDGKPYASIDDWKPKGERTQRQAQPEPAADDFEGDSIPF